MNLLLKALMILWIVGNVAKANAQQSHPAFSKEQLLQDFGIFSTALQEAHPGLYWYTSKGEMNALLAKTKSQIRDGMSEEQYYKLLLPLIVKIRCGHTKWFRNDKADDRYAFYSDNLFPLKLYFVDNRAFVIGDYAGSSNIPALSEVYSINGKTVPQIRKKINESIPTDGYVQSFLDEELNHFFSGYFATFVDHGPQYTVLFKTPSGKASITLAGVSLSAINAVEQKQKDTYRKPLRLEQLNPSTALLTIDRFMIPKEEQDFYSFIDSAFLALKKKQTTNLVIDVRNNEGGEESFGGYLFSYLAKAPFRYYKKITVAQKEPFSFLQYSWVPPPYEGERQKLVENEGEVLWLGQPYLQEHQPNANAFSGKVFVLTNGLSFSVTSEWASMMHHHQRATFVGAETGGAYYRNSSGVFTVVTLPNTKLGVGIPLLGFHSNVAAGVNAGRGIIPHYEVKRTASDVITGKDAALHFTLNLIQKEEKHLVNNSNGGREKK